MQEQLLQKVKVQKMEYLYARPFRKKYGILSEEVLRERIKRGEVPGIKTPKGFKINVELFLNQLAEESRGNVIGGAAL